MNEMIEELDADGDEPDEADDDGDDDGLMTADEAM